MESRILENIYVMIQKEQKHEKRILRRRKEKKRKRVARKCEVSKRDVEARKIFNECKGQRMRKRVHNTFCRDYANSSNY